MRHLWVVHGIAAAGFLLRFLRDPCDPNWRVTKIVTTQAAFVTAGIESFCYIAVYNLGVADVHEALCLPIGAGSGAVAALAMRLYSQQAIMQRVPPYCVCREGEDDGDNGNATDSPQQPLSAATPSVEDSLHSQQDTIQDIQYEL